MTARRETPSERAKRLWADPAFRARVSAAQKVARAKPGWRAKQRAQALAYWAQPEARAAQSARKKRLYAERPEMLAAARGYFAIGLMVRDAFFTCPAGLKPLYEKLRRALPLEEAREEIRRIIRETTPFDYGDEVVDG